MLFFELNITLVPIMNIHISRQVVACSVGGAWKFIILISLFNNIPNEIQCPLCILFGYRGDPENKLMDSISVVTLLRTTMQYALLAVLSQSLVRGR